MKRLLIITCCIFLAACSGDNDSSQAQPASQQPQIASASPGPAQNRNKFSSLTPMQAKQLIQSKKNLLILDVRSPAELKEGKIAGSTLVPFMKIAKGEYKVPADQPVLIVCAVGGRSYAVGKYLSQTGYPEIYNLQSGISGWKRDGLPLVY
jgi:rhodanese-related sulfurtransferase